jgi:hypothetical protein
MHPLTRELLAWVAARPRTYAEAMEAWRSHCPRHSTWEDACIDGLIEVLDEGPDAAMVVMTERGRAALAAPTVRNQTISKAAG